jgi:hypothetical protein
MAFLLRVFDKKLNRVTNYIVDRKFNKCQAQEFILLPIKKPKLT